MSECKLAKELLHLYVAGDGLSLKEEMFVNAHLKKCEKCQLETQNLKKIINSSKQMDEEIDSLIGTIDWNKNRENILEKIVQQDEPTININYSNNRFFSFKTGVLAASLFLIGILTGYFVFYSPQMDTSIQNSMSNNLHSVTIIEKNFKKNTIIDYFDQVNFYFLEIIESENFNNINQKQNKRLLAQTRYLQNSIKNDFSLISAKEILKDIEFVLIEINSNIGVAQNENFKFIKNLISNKRLLLKIHLAKKDLKNIRTEV